MGDHNNRDFQIAFIFSALGHVVLFYFFLVAAGPSVSDFGKPMVYSVSIESGGKLGGISQLPKTKKKTSAPPPKKAKVKTAPKKKEIAKVKDAEVSLAEKKKEKVKKEAPKKKVPPKKVVPKKKPPKKKVSKPKEPSLDEIDKHLQEAMQRYTGESTDAGGKGFGSAGGIGKGMGGGQVRPPEFFYYRKELEVHIKSGWRWHDTTANLEARVCFRILTNGELRGVKLCAPSGHRGYDDSVIRAVHKANPVPVPPKKVYHFFKEVRMTFQPGD